jgi:hypothetical protein
MLGGWPTTPWVVGVAARHPMWPTKKERASVGKYGRGWRLLKFEKNNMVFCSHFNFFANFLNC